MLYEVITPPLVFLSSPFEPSQSLAPVLIKTSSCLETFFSKISFELSLRYFQTLRITSYNVCYTKLLRNSLSAILEKNLPSISNFKLLPNRLDASRLNILLLDSKSNTLPINIEVF